MKRLIFFLVIILSSLEVSHGIFGRKKTRPTWKPPDDDSEGESSHYNDPQLGISAELARLEQVLNGGDPEFGYGPTEYPHKQWGCPCDRPEEDESGNTGCWGKKKPNKKGKDHKGKGKKGKGNKGHKGKGKKGKGNKDKGKKDKNKKLKSSFWPKKTTTPDPNESLYDNV